MLVIESGGTKSTWIFGADASTYQTMETVGLHPQELSDEKQNTIADFIQKHSLSGASTFFYGAGCESDVAQKKIMNFLTTLSLHVIEINTDLFAACRAHLGNSEGIVGILGTGAIVAQFDGQKIIKKTSGLGYLLGDEGSGYDIGKRLLQAYYRNDLSTALCAEIDNYFENKPILHRIYAPDGRMVIAGLSKIAYRWRKEAVIRQLLKQAFTDFCITALNPLSLQHDKYEIHFVGSIAFHFSEELREVLVENEYEMGTIFPIAAQEVFHHLIDEK